MENVKVNKAVSKISEILNELDMEDSQTVSQLIHSMYGYNTDPYPLVPNMKCKKCGTYFFGDEEWEDGEGSYGCDCPICGEAIIIRENKNNKKDC